VQGLVAVILTKNEAQHISDCVKSVVGWTDAVIVWDSCSSDATPQLAYLAGAKVIERPFDSYAAQRQAALDSLNAEWVLFIDADERVTPALRDEIREALVNPSAAGFWIPRRNIIVGKEIHGGGFYPDYQLRLIKRTGARYVSERAVHEIVEVDGAEAQLREPLLHFNYVTWEQFHAKQRGYARYEAGILAGRGIRPRPHNFVLQPLREFRRRYFTLGGYRDGMHGLRLAMLLAWYYGFIPYWELWRGASHS
jgi:glycosyltransferase involved in cell wall biosynthesis